MNLKIIVLSLTAGILLVSAYVFSFDYFAAQTEQTEQIFCIQDTKQCPDGSYVGRTGPKCEFANCPTLSFGQSDTSNWKTYRNKKYGFEVRYPQSWRVTRAGITDPEPMPYLLNDIIFDPSNQFREIFIKVYDEKYISMYNFSQDQMVILAACKELQSPVMIGTSEGEQKFIGSAQARTMINAYRDEYKLPLFLNADHHKSVGTAQEAIVADYDSIHIDLSVMNLEENIKGTKEIVEFARQKSKTRNPN